MVVPKLRFKEFESTVEVRKLGNISNIVVGFVGTVSDQYCDQNEGIPFVRTQNVRDGYFSVENLEYVTRDFHKKNKKSQIFNGDVLIARVGANMGMVCAVENLDTEANCANVIIIKNNLQLNSQYLSLFLNSENGQKQIHSGGAGGAQAVFNTTLAKEISFPYFPLQEQTKIASFLSAVDEKISQLTQKHELLSQYKQGMMQKLFSQQIRFKADDGSEFGEWEEVKFSGIFNFHQTNSYSRALLAEYGEIMNIHYGDIHTKFSMLFDVNKESVPFLNDEVDTSKIAKEQFLKVGDLVIADASEDYKDIGKSIEVISLNNQKVVAGLHTYIARPVKPFALGFCGYMMQTFPVREQIKKLATGISVLGISKTNLGKVELKVPSLEEQTKIANFLSAIDQKIEVVVQQIEQAKTWKKGLLQQMFV